MIMESSQLKIVYYPKYTESFQWPTDGVDLQAYLDMNSEESIEKKMDGSSLPFILKTFGSYNGTYNSITRVFTFTGVNWEVNRWRWHSLTDSNNNRFVIQSNTANTITIGNPVNFKTKKAPVTGMITIGMPNFNNEDIIEIYGWKVRDKNYTEPVAFENKIIFIGQISGRQIKNDSRGSQIAIKLMNMTELLLKTTQMWAVSDSNFLTAPQKIGNIIEIVNGRNMGLIHIEFDPNDHLTNTKGDPFPPLNYYRDDSPAYEAILELSRKEWTDDDVEYYSYIKPIGERRYKFVWAPKLETIGREITEGIDFDLISFNNDRAEVISSLVVVCGKDANNNTIRQTVYGDFRYGSRTKRISSTITTNIFMYETDKNRASFDFIEDQKYPTSYPYTTAISVTDEEVKVGKGTFFGNFLNVTGQYTLTNKTDFNKFIRYLSRARAIVYGRDYLGGTRRTRDVLVLRFYATPASNIPGSVDNLVIPSIGWTGDGYNISDTTKVMRLSTRKISVNKDGLYTECEYSEDKRFDKLEAK